MFVGEWLESLHESGGLVGTLAAALVGLYWFVTKGLPVINSNMSGIARENTARSDMLAVLREERDAALAREAAAEERYTNLLKDWAEMRGQFKSLESDLSAGQCADRRTEGPTEGGHDHHRRAEA